MALDPGSAGWSFASHGSVDVDTDGLLAADEPQQIVNDAVRTLAENVARQRDETLAALPPGARLCLHDQVDVSSSGFKLDDDHARITLTQRGHTLLAGEQCHHRGGRAEYGPMPALAANMIKACLPVADGVCPDCGKPAAYAETPYVRVHHDADFRLDQAAEDACPAVIRAREAAERYAIDFDQLFAGAADPTGPPAASEPEDPYGLYDKLREMFKRVSAQPGYTAEVPVVSPVTLERHKAAADLPRAPWVAIKAAIDDPDTAACWMQPDLVGTFSPGVDSWGSIWGRRLFRTGTFLARPDGNGGWDVAEVMVTR